jgi:hypothetical protein
VDHLSLVPLVTGLTPFEAKVLTARLGADGFIWQVRGAMDSVYPVGTIEVLVPAADVDDARALVLISTEGYDEESAAYFGMGSDEDASGRPTVRWWVGALVISATVTFFFMRLLAFG